MEAPVIPNFGAVPPTAIGGPVRPMVGLPPGMPMQRPPMAPGGAPPGLAGAMQNVPGGMPAQANPMLAALQQQAALRQPQLGMQPQPQYGAQIPAAAQFGGMTGFGQNWSGPRPYFGAPTTTGLRSLR